ncbi:hypothetical protein AB0G83_07515 [Streptomyces klenkii]|uniref:hypothetical protein n=1 Tax=Streptomyces klenkii TaxID=1420899 RepID=UPI0033EDCE8D
MAVPPIAAWAPREIVTAEKLNTQMREPLRYLSDMPRLSCRGAAPGQTVLPGSSTYIRWAIAETKTFVADGERRWFTVPDSGVYVLSGSVSVKSGPAQPYGDGVIIYVYRRTTAGAVSVATVREIVQQSNDIQIISAVTIAHLTAGDSIGVAVYLEAGSPSSSYTVQAGEWETVFGAWMAAPSASFSAPPSAYVSAGDWRDGERVTPALMRARLSDPLTSLYNPSRFSLRSTLPYSAPSNQTARVGWSNAGFEESGGWVLSRDGATLTAPATGVYLVALSVATQRDGPEGAFGSYQVHLLRNGNLISLRQRQNTRSTYPTAISGTEPVFLTKGDQLSAAFLGTGTGLAWQAFGSDIRDERWNGFSAVMLAPAATGMKG